MISFQKSCFVIFALATLFLSSQVLAKTSQKVAKVIMLKGKATYEFNGDESPLKVGDLIKEGATTSTSEKSVLKIKYHNGNTVVLGPNSIMKTTKFKKNKVKVLSLLRGAVRVKVEKKYNAKNMKMLIKTKSASMGVRGTDFHVTYNETNNNTGVLSYGGAVSMTNEIVEVRGVPKKLRGANVILPGRFAKTSPDLSKASIPVKISPSQFALLKSGIKKSGRGKAKSYKRFKSPFPPGINIKSLKKRASGLNQQILNTVGKKSFKKFRRKVNNNPNGLTVKTAPPEGIYNQKTKEFAPPAGGLIDLNTGLYIAPPEGSTYDPNTETFIPPKSLGQTDPMTGEYVPPPGYKLGSDGSFDIVNKELAAKNDPPPLKEIGKISVIEKSGRASQTPDSIKKVLNLHGIKDQAGFFDKDKDFNALGPTLNERLTGTNATFRFEVTD